MQSYVSNRGWFQTFRVADFFGENGVVVSSRLFFNGIASYKACNSSMKTA